ncbi:hypothetical protein CHUAL_001098 [Chamberlinius hualienensis]
MLGNVSIRVICNQLMRTNIQPLQISTRQLRGGSRAPVNSLEDIDNSHTTVLNENGSMIVSWHPEQDFPYEFSKPMPIFEPSIKEGDSVLNLQYRIEDSKRFIDKDADWKGLSKITYTNKHIWYPQPKIKRRFKPPEPDREGL